MDDGDAREKMRRLEAGVADLAATVERGRNVSLAAMAVLVAAGVVILAITIGAIGFDPAAVIGALIALGIGMAFLAWHRHKLGLLAAVLRTVEAHKAELVDKIDLP